MTVRTISGTDDDNAIIVTTPTADVWTGLISSAGVLAVFYWLQFWWRGATIFEAFVLVVFPLYLSISVLRRKIVVRPRLVTSRTVFRTKWVRMPPVVLLRSEGSVVRLVDESGNVLFSFRPNLSHGGDLQTTLAKMFRSESEGPVD